MTYTHGLSNTREYKIWKMIKYRCLKKTSKDYKHYGKRGIKLCDRWLESFENFYEDMGERPSKNHSIERINNEGDYEPNNCRWATVIEQRNNMRSNHTFTYKNKTQTLAMWCRELNFNYPSIRDRIFKLKWPIDKALETPIRPMKTSNNI